MTAEQIPGAIDAIEAAIAADDRARAEAAAQAAQDGQDAAEDRNEAVVVHLRQRAAPLLDMLRRSAAEGRDVTW